MSGIWRTALVAMATFALTGQVSAQTPEEFYKGKTVDLVIGYPPGGSNDTWGRLLARHIGKHIPGKPTIVPKNMPGAGSFLAANTVFNVSPKDGTVIAIAAPTTPLDERLGTAGVRFKTAEFNWIGRVDSLVNMVFMWNTSPVKTFADALKTPATLSATGVGSTVYVYPNVTNRVLGTKFKLILGYKGSAEAMLAVERGEAEGHSTSWVALKVAHPDWVRDKKVSILVQYALKRHPEMADVPTVVELAQQRRAARRPERGGQRRRGRLGLLHHARRAGGPARRTSPRLRRHHEGPGIPRRGGADQAQGQPVHRRGTAEAGAFGQRPAARPAGQDQGRLFGEIEIIAARHRPYTPNARLPAECACGRAASMLHCTMARQQNDPAIGRQ